MRRRRFLVVCFAVLFAALGIYWWQHFRGPVPPTEIYQGITYGCERLDADDEGSGLVHWVRVDLTAPGIELYVTPLDEEAVERGWQYRLQYTATVLKQEQLAVATNAVYFTSDSRWIRWAGDFARSDEATIANYVVSHVPPSTYMLCFDEHLASQIERSWPPKDSTAPRFRWGLGDQGGPMLWHGQLYKDTPRTPIDARTAVGIDREKRLLFLAVFERASMRRALEKLAQLGAVDGMLLDGGTSTTMSLGKKADGIRSGVLLGGWRPVATHFGVRARELVTK